MTEPSEQTILLTRQDEKLDRIADQVGQIAAQLSAMNARSEETARRLKELESDRHETPCAMLRCLQDSFGRHQADKEAEIADRHALIRTIRGALVAAVVSGVLGAFWLGFKLLVKQ